jgi:hypothetical protein
MLQVNKREIVKEHEKILREQGVVGHELCGLLLYEVANRSLNLTIEQIGRDRFDRALADFRRLEAKAMQVCGDHLGSGCIGDGVALPETTCCVRDLGCGHKRVDAMLRDEKRSTVYRSSVGTACLPVWLETWTSLEFFSSDESFATTMDFLAVDLLCCPCVCVC